MQIARAKALRTAVPLAGLVAAVALLGAPAAPAAKPAPKPKIVTVNDFFFGPSAVTINKGGSVKWVWSELNSYPHDVHLKQGPKGLAKKASYSTKTTAVTEAEFKKKFETPGTYKFICTIHPTEMKLTVTVKK
ncbi:MAG TPA: plastocyanin/azurin family copper-binding protein [Solirubrobacterales bacterium]|nr:plastocyanin/azurin family copper-binding protein [Solirubrobacterales bacterium]